MPRRSPPHDESLGPRLLHALTACEMPPRYYAWCDRFPLHPVEERESYQPSRDAMLAAWAATAVPVTKPARRYQVASRRAGDLMAQVGTSTYRFGGTIVVSAGVVGPTGIYFKDLAILSVELLDRAGSPRPVPPFPRPVVTSDQELADLVVEVAALLTDLAHVIEAAGAGGEV